MFKSPTCGPLGVAILHICPARTVQACPERRRIVVLYSNLRLPGMFADSAIRVYKGREAWTGESAGALYAGAGV